MYVDDYYSSNTTSDDFYFDKNGNVVYTEKYLSERGYCCGNKCKHCPYKPKYKKGNTKI
jgi:biotin synthase-like enzyme